MQRISTPERPNWQQTVVAQGLAYYHTDGQPYWLEKNCYQFSEKEIEQIETATADLHEICLEAVDYAIGSNNLGLLGLPASIHQQVAESWARQDPFIFGRFDLAFDGKTPPKMLEYNADTPFTLPEASAIQLGWFVEKQQNGTIPPEADQFNMIFDSLIKAWKQAAAQITPNDPVHFTCDFRIKNNKVTSIEDVQNLKMMRLAAEQAGFEAKMIDIAKIGWSGKNYIDQKGKPIKTLFKLYPWEWMLRDKGAKRLEQSPMHIIEPLWKEALQSKALMALMWQRNPNHPNLLPTYFDPSPLGESYVRKPFFSRQGANVEIIENHNLSQLTAGGYGAEGHIFQALNPLPNFNDYHPVIGSWVSSEKIDNPSRPYSQKRGGKSCGISLREDKSLITQNYSPFVPHYYL